MVKKEKELNRFIPWHEDELTPKFWKSRGVINVEDNVNLRTIEDIGLLFDVKIAHRGYLKAGAAKYDKSGFAEVWWPSAAKRANWENKFSSDFTVITERNLDSLKAEKHVQSTIAKNPNIKRIVFFKYRDELGFDYYKFVGCFELNPDKTLKEKQLVWERISQMYSFEEKKSEQKVPSD